MCQGESISRGRSGGDGGLGLPAGGIRLKALFLVIFSFLKKFYGLVLL